MGKYAWVRGYVTNLHYRVCIGAHVIFSDEADLKKSYEVIANQERYFDIRGVLPGRYAVRVDGCDFTNGPYTTLQLSAGEMLFLSIVGREQHEIIAQ